MHLPKQSMFFLLLVWSTLSQPHFGAKCEKATHTPKSGKMKPSGTLENSEDNLRGSNLLALVRSLYQWKDFEV